MGCTSAKATMEKVEVPSEIKIKTSENNENKRQSEINAYDFNDEFWNYFEI